MVRQSLEPPLKPWYLALSALSQVKEAEIIEQQSAARQPQAVQAQPVSDYSAQWAEYYRFRPTPTAPSTSPVPFSCLPLTLLLILTLLHLMALMLIQGGNICLKKEFFLHTILRI